MAASSGSDGGLTGFPAGLSLCRALSLVLGFDLPIFVGRSLRMRLLGVPSLLLRSNIFFSDEFSIERRENNNMPYISGINRSITHIY